VTRWPAKLARIGALALLCAATPAIASDFTGFLTLMASLSGAVFLAIFLSVFFASRALPEGNTRFVARVVGALTGVGVTVWWIADPIAEGTAILILMSIVVIAVIGCVSIGKPAR
jgi:uncharacterized membrane-anchored protein YitT (DUF2179 family)